MFVQASGSGAGLTTDSKVDSDVLENLEANRSRQITVKFNADTASSMLWNFRPQQAEVKVRLPGGVIYLFTANKMDKILNNFYLV